MRVTEQVRQILSWYEGETPGVKTNLVRLLMQGRLAGSGKLVILPVDQGYEHGPARSFAPNPAAYDPHYLYELAIEAGLSAYAAHMAALMGAHIIKVKPPKAAIDLDAAKATYEKARVPMETLKERIAHVMQCCFAGKRLVVFSGGEAKGTEGLLEDIRQIRDGGGCGSIIGPHSFPPPP